MHDIQIVIRSLEGCLSHSTSDMIINKRRLIDAKTELLVGAPKHHFGRLLKAADGNFV